MHPLLLPFIALEVPVLFVFAFSVIFLGRKRPDHWLFKLLTFEFPLIAVGGVGLPIWMVIQLLQAR